MFESHVITLQKLGLAPSEAEIYLSLAQAGRPLSASAVVAASGIARGTIYPTLNSLVGRGIVQNGEGYGSKFVALPPDEALPRLIAAEKEKLSECEARTADLIKEFQVTANDKPDSTEGKLIEVLRDPRVFSVRLQTLQREARQEINVIVKHPFILKNVNASGNPDEIKSLKRGVRHRVLYEEAVFGDENLARYLKSWIKAGEQARVYKGTLPLKFLLFDSHTAWMPLDTQAKRHPIVSVLIRHHALGQALRFLFDFLWRESEPIRFGAGPPRKRVGRTRNKRRTK
jgi:sugar-specific transcriptional regulator TrmB